jgi:death on curing protein
MIDPIWISKETALAMHRRQLAEHGGLDGVRDEGLLESALARPQQIFAYGDPDLCRMATGYAFGIARNHPFLDGNKRTALVAMDTFLVLNGFELVADPVEVYTTILALAAGDTSEEQLYGWLKMRIEELKN